MTFRLTSGRKAVLRSLLDLARDQVIAAALPEPHDYPPAWGEDGTQRGAEVERCEPQSVTLFTLHKRAERFDIEGDGNVYDCPTCKLDLDGSLLAVSSIDLAVGVLEHEASDHGRDWTLRICELLDAAQKAAPMRYATTFWPPRKRVGAGQRPPLLASLTQFFLTLSAARSEGATTQDTSAAESFMASMDEDIGEVLRAKADGNPIVLATRQQPEKKGGEA